MRDIELEKAIDQLLDTLTKERKRQGLSYGEISRRTGLHRSTISLLESKKRTPTVLVALKIAKALDIKLSEVLETLSV